MKKLRLVLLWMVILLTAASCASGPQGPDKPGMPWISQEKCPNYVQMGDMAKISFRYQGDELPSHAEFTANKLTIIDSPYYATAPINYLYDDRFEVLLKLGSNPFTWNVVFYVVDRKGRFSNELSCQLTVR